MHPFLSMILNLTIRDDCTAEQLCSNGSPVKVFLPFHVVMQAPCDVILTVALWLLPCVFPVEVALVISRIECGEVHDVSISSASHLLCFIPRSFAELSRCFLMNFDQECVSTCFWAFALESTSVGAYDCSNRIPCILCHFMIKSTHAFDCICKF